MDKVKRNYENIIDYDETYSADMCGFQVEAYKHIPFVQKVSMAELFAQAVVREEGGCWFVDNNAEYVAWVLLMQAYTDVDTDNMTDDELFDLFTATGEKVYDSDIFKGDAFNAYEMMDAAANKLAERMNKAVSLERAVTKMFEKMNNDDMKNVARSAEVNNILVEAMNRMQSGEVQMLPYNVNIKKRK